ncbi:MAG: hypothetical protein GXY64_03000 [Bacteroidales bacterium]|nr:hypothetical protein [Bacteroidales bacterium]
MNIDIKGGKNQILPNATYSIQNIFLNQPSMLQYVYPQRIETDAPCVVNMKYYSSTFPFPAENEMSRRGDIADAEEQLERNHVICFTGEKGVGLTTLLAQFVDCHSENCVSYFYNGMERGRLNPEVMEHDLLNQLCWFLYGKRTGYAPSPLRVERLTSIYCDILRRFRLMDQPLYFVFDGFDHIPSELFGGVQKIFDSIYFDHARYVFSGNWDKIKGLFRDSNIRCASHAVMRFGETEVSNYFLQSDQTLNDATLSKLYAITHGNAQRMNFVRERYVEKGLLDHLMQSSVTIESELTDDDSKGLFGKKMIRSVIPWLN